MIFDLVCIRNSILESYLTRLLRRAVVRSEVVMSYPVWH